MASSIKIKRSEVSGNPTTLGAGELAYSALPDNGFNGGDRLYIGMGTETDGNAVNHFVIGGKYFTDMLDHVKGTLTADSALIVDSNSKIDIINVDNITIDGNTISSTNTNGNIVLDPNGTGYVQVAGTNGLVIPVGSSAQQGPAVAGAIRYNSDTSQFEGYSGSNWSSLGGVRSVDGQTFITAELTPGTSDDTLRFYTDGTSRMSIDTDSIDVSGTITIFNIDATTASTSASTGALVVDGGVGIGGNLNVAGTVVATSGIENTAIGDVTPSTGAFTQVSVDNLQFDGNTIVSTDPNGNINITPDGTGKTVITNLYIGSDSLLEYIQDATGNQLLAGEGIDVSYNDSTGQTTISAEVATDSNLGVASFNTNDFTVSSGSVAIKTGGVTNTQLENSTITIGSTTVALGATSTSIAGVTELTVDNLNFNGNTITATNTDGSINLVPDGSGTVDVSGAKITAVGAPTQSTDAATKQYVDTVAEGLTALPAAKGATTANLSATYANGGLSATLTSTTNGAFPTIDSVTYEVGDNILVKDQTNAAENGSYVLTTLGDGSNPWVLTRCDFCNESSEIPGSFEFVQNGTLYGNTGWVATVDDSSTFTIGTDDINWVQFSGAGTFLAGDGLELDGTTFNVLLSTTGGLEFTGSNAIGLKAGVGGNGLVNTDGVLDVVGTADRITVSADAVDIATTYAGQSSITTLGTIGTGTWQGTIISPTYGGTGVNNGSKTITLGGDFTHTGAHTLGLTTTANTSLTLPTSGTLATLSGTETFANKTINNSSIGSTNPNTGAFTTLTASGAVTFTSSTGTTSSSTGALVVTGGVGVGENIQVAGDVVGSGVETSNIEGFTVDGGTY